MASPFIDTSGNSLDSNLNFTSYSDESSNSLSFPSSSFNNQNSNVESTGSQLDYLTHRRHANALTNHSTLPVNIVEVRVQNAPGVRRSLLEKLVNPLITANQIPEYTLNDLLTDALNAREKLGKLGIFRHPISVHIDRIDPSAPFNSFDNLLIQYNVQELPRLKISSGTELGNADGSFYITSCFRNLFGGSESLRFALRRGIKTRSAFSAIFDSPLFNNPDLRLEISANTSSTAKPWASHDEDQKVGLASIDYYSPCNHFHRFTYSGSWRQIHSLTPDAPPSIRKEAGDSFKSSLAHTWILDRRISHIPALPGRILPLSGYYLKTISELAGFGPLGGDVNFLKTAIEMQSALPLSCSSQAGKSLNPSENLPHCGASLVTSLRAGFLCPLPGGYDLSSKSLVYPSRFSDRFQLGGPNDVRGFRLAGLGPREGNNSLGGDMFAAGGLSLIAPFVGLDRRNPLRFHAFINTGRLIALSSDATANHNNHSSASEKGMDLANSKLVTNAVTPPNAGEGMMWSNYTKLIKNVIKNPGASFPSTSAGIGIIYAHPAARFELNFSIPISVHHGESVRSGVSFGVGMDLL